MDCEHKQCRGTAFYEVAIVGRLQDATVRVCEEHRDARLATGIYESLGEICPDCGLGDGDHGEGCSVYSDRSEHPVEAALGRMFFPDDYR